MENLNERQQIEEMAKDICRVSQNCNDVCHPTSTCNALKYAKRAYEADYRKQEWISVEDRLPEHYEYCLLFLDNETMEIGWYHEVAKKFVVGGLVTLNMITHWMPLPEAPKMKGDSDAR